MKFIFPLVSKRSLQSNLFDGEAIYLIPIQIVANEVSNVALRRSENPIFSNLRSTDFFYRR